MLRIAALTTAGIAVSGCTYDVGLGYASDSYGNGYYDCDPYNTFGSYYDCDYGYGFSNIGYGGGWYDSYWYPGYGVFLFDNYGRRYAMRDNHRRYWGDRRYRWYRENRGRNDGYGKRDRRDGRNYVDGGRGLDPIGWPERNGGRARDGERGERSRGEGRRGRNDQWRGGTGAGGVPEPNPEYVNGQGRAERNRDGWRGTEPGQGRRARRGYDGTMEAVQQPDRPALRSGGNGGEGRGGNRQSVPISGNENQSAAPRVVPETTAPRAGSQPVSRRDRDLPEGLPD